MPRAEPNCQVREREAREALGNDGKEKEFVKKSAGRISKAYLSRSHETGGKISSRRNGVGGKKGESEKDVQGQEVRQKGRREREVCAADGEVLKLLKWRLNSCLLRRLIVELQTNEACAGNDFAQKAMEMPAKSEAEEKVLPMEEGVDCSQARKGIEEVTAVKDVQSTEMEGGYVMCEHIGEVGEEQQPVRGKAPPQKRTAVTRVESADTQDYLSGQQGLEELGQEEIEELSFVPSAVSEPQLALHMSNWPS